MARQVNCIIEYFSFFVRMFLATVQKERAWKEHGVQEMAFKEKHDKTEERDKKHEKQQKKLELTGADEKTKKMNEAEIKHHEKAEKLSKQEAKAKAEEKPKKDMTPPRWHW